MLDEKAAKHIGYGFAWLGFWIGLGLYNFQGCVPQAKEWRSLREAK